MPDAEPPSARKANTLAVIDFVLGHTLRLFHPFLPFITEELWHGLGFNSDLPDDQGARTIQFARWPQPLDDEFKKHYGLTPNAEQFANAKYETVSAGRRLRRDFNIASNKRVLFVLRPSASAERRGSGRLAHPAQRGAARPDAELRSRPRERRPHSRRSANFICRSKA